MKIGGEKLKIAAPYNKKLNRILGIDLSHKFIYQSHGLRAHMMKRGHRKYLPYLDKIPEIIRYPDYAGVNTKDGFGLELIKRYDENILVAVKLDKTHRYLYVATLYGISPDKVERRLYSGRLTHCKKV